MTRIALIAALVAGCAAIPAVPASAAPAGRMAVSYADLDLSRPSDRARLRRRIATAIDALCGSHATAESSADAEISRCRTEARAGAETQLASILGRAVQVAEANVGRGGR